MAPSKPSLWREFWNLAKPYWTSEERWSAYGLLAVIVGMSLGLVYLEVLFNDWNKVFYDSLQNRDQNIFFEQLIRFSYLAAIYIVVTVYLLYLNQMLQVRWRRWMTDQYLNDWLEKRAYYRMQLADQGTDNPDQRIAEDIKAFIQLSLSLSLGLLSAVVTLISFIFILWEISGPLIFSLGQSEIEIPAYMLWAAVLYAIVGTYATHKVGRPLIALDFNRQRYEADFRFSLVRLRENAEAVALYGGEAREKAAFSGRFSNVLGNFWEIMRQRKRISFLITGYAQLAVIFPFVVAAPRFFSGAIQLGDLTQIASAFGQVQSSLSYIITSYTEIAEWRAVVLRLVGFRAALDTAKDIHERNAIDIVAGSTPALDIDRLNIGFPQGGLLLESFGLHIDEGQSLLIRGGSGSGKSTLFRAIAGIWPFGRGTIAIPKGARTMFLPQKPYLPLGSLTEALAYPEDPAKTTDAAKEQALIDCGLEAFIPRLHEVQNWSQILSLGEQQRLAFARVLLKRPDWLFLDEATASVDPALEETLYHKLKERLPETTVISIGHRDSLRAFHANEITLTQRMAETSVSAAD